MEVGRGLFLEAITEITMRNEQHSYFYSQAGNVAKQKVHALHAQDLGLDSWNPNF